MTYLLVSVKSAVLTRCRLSFNSTTQADLAKSICPSSIASRNESSLVEHNSTSRFSVNDITLRPVHEWTSAVVLSLNDIPWSLLEYFESASAFLDLETNVKQLVELKETGGWVTNTFSTRTRYWSLVHLDLELLCIFLCSSFLQLYLAVALHSQAVIWIKYCI